jgi:hypothetical protein
MNARQWWNGRWSRLARREVFMRQSGSHWAVELRRGGEGGRSRTKVFGAEAEALAWVHDRLVGGDDGWREVDPYWLRKVAPIKVSGQLL